MQPKASAPALVNPFDSSLPFQAKAPNLSGGLNIDLVDRNYNPSSSSSNFGAVQIDSLSFDSTNATKPYSVKTQKLAQTVQDLNWDIKGVADINKDGIGDLFWRNKETGENAVWLMARDGANIELGKGVFLDSADKSWQIKGIADFDNDGKTNVLWQRSNGEAAIWGLDYNINNTGNPISLDLTKTQFIKSTSEDWSMQGWADFTKDGISDIFWKNQSTGETAIWELNSNGVSPDPFFSKGYLVQNVGANSAWVVEGVADINKDGVNDIVWRNSETNDTAIWSMGIEDGETKIGTAYTLADKPSSASWQLTSVADINRDGTPDFIWSNYETSENAVWEIQVDNLGQPSLKKGYFLEDSNDANWRFGAIAYGEVAA
jgi:hypothetical protein